MLSIKSSKIEINRSWNLSIALAMADKWEGSLLFSSPETEGNHQNILGINPLLTISSAQCNLTHIDRLMAQNNINFPWIMGFVSYDAKSYFEEKDIYKDLKDTSFPDFSFYVYQYIFVFDKNWNLLDARELSIDMPLNVILNINDLEMFQHRRSSGFQVSMLNSSPNEKYFKQGVDKIKNYIRAGDVYQVNLTRKITCSFKGDEVAAAEALLTSNLIEFGVFYKSNGRYLISTSPERLFRTAGNRILASPIKGTAERSGNDEQVRDALLNDTKNLRELAMITDLLRNDISRICRPGTVEVKGYPILKTLRNVFHLVADIEGGLTENRFSEIMRAMFPGGSITGCPKIRACQIIEELEQKGRGPYTGSFGYVSSEKMDFNILIRTVFIENNQLTFNVGGGITLLSDAQDEYEETEHKARNIVAALGIE